MPGDRCAEPAGFLQWANPWRRVDRAKALSCQIPEQIKSISKLDDKKKMCPAVCTCTRDSSLKPKKLCSYSLVSSITYVCFSLPLYILYQIRPDVWGTGATWIPSWSSTVIGIGLDASAKLEYISKCICIFKGSEITLVVLSRNEKSTITITATGFISCTSPARLLGASCLMSAHRRLDINIRPINKICCGSSKSRRGHEHL